MKCDEDSRFGRRWNIYESMLHPPVDAMSVVPNTNTFEIKCKDKLFTISGVLFCGEDGLSKSCVHTTMRSIASLALNRDVSFQEILSIECLRGKDPVEGMSVKEIHAVFDALKVPYNSVDFSMMDAMNAGLPKPEEFILSAISAGSGAFLGFAVSDFNHLISVYGYIYDPVSVDFLTTAHYFKADRDVGRSISHWIGSYVCNDGNLGTYYHLPKNSPVISNATFISACLCHPAHYDAIQAEAIASNVLSSVIGSLPKTTEYWIQRLHHASTTNELILHATLLPCSKYLTYLSSVRDWHRFKESSDLITILKEHLDEPFIWVVEYSLADLIPSFQKLGEVVLLDTLITYDGSSGLMDLMILTRMPSSYFLNNKDGLVSIKSNLGHQTPFIQKQGSGHIIMQNYDYDVALSFAGEDRVIVEAVADLLKSKNITVFYDQYEKAVLWGKDLYQHLQGVYRDRAKYCVVFTSAAYAEKLWTRHELKQAQARAFQENEEYILPVRLDDTLIPGINDTTGYLDLRQEALGTLVDLLIEKLSLV